MEPSTYLAAIRAEVPSYDALEDAVAQAAAHRDASRILELGVGTGETAARVLRQQPHASLVAIDASEEMVEVASRRLPDADVRVARLEDPLPTGRYDLIVSALAVHHLPSRQKADLFERVASALEVGGRFVLADVVVPDDPADARTPLEAGVDLPDTVADQLRWLTAAGLASSVAWQHQDLVVVVADRAA
jgi:tRNA (cmo5U34)-methyltransferase